jgi:hypothetical protein
MVAMDVLEMSPETKRGNRKVLVIGDMFSRYVVAVPKSDESPTPWRECSLTGGVCVRAA